MGEGEVIDWSKPVQTRDGRAVVIYTRERDSEHSVVGDIIWPYGTYSLCKWKADGSIGHGTAPADLVNVPEEPKEHEVWLNIYWDSVPGRSSVIAYASRNMADKCASNSRIACKLVPFFEGEGLG